MKTLFLVLFALAPLAQASVSDNLKKFEINTGTYEVQTDASSICKYAYRIIDLKIDVLEKTLTLDQKYSGEGSLDEVMAISADLKKTYHVPCLTCSVSEVRYVVKGNAVITQSRVYDMFSNPFKPAFWHDEEAVISFPDAKTMIFNFESLPCVYKKLN
jgi:hypothetical protein